ncbi:MAG: hypothetical protein IPK82_06565 [Polyangiaceae bacterium]|nr:hypothetical protein [Polyangiaceae bacterium]
MVPTFSSLLFGLAAGVTLVCLGCSPYDTQIVLCDQIPDGGCPTGRGGTCEDKLCQALYDCVNGVWQRTEVCEGNAAGAGGSGGNLPSGGSGGSVGGLGGAGGECTPVMFDHSNDAEGCTPDLQTPDCPAAVAESCAEQACTTGCLDFFLCTQNGWNAVAYCDEDGNFFVAPR